MCACECVMGIYPPIRGLLTPACQLESKYKKLRPTVLLISCMNLLYHQFGWNEVSYRFIVWWSALMLWSILFHVSFSLFLSLSLICGDGGSSWLSKPKWCWFYGHKVGDPHWNDGKDMAKEMSSTRAPVSEPPERSGEVLTESRIFQKKTWIIFLTSFSPKTLFPLSLSSFLPRALGMPSWRTDSVNLISCNQGKTWCGWADERGCSYGGSFNWPAVGARIGPFDRAEPEILNNFPLNQSLSMCDGCCDRAYCHMIFISLKYILDAHIGRFVIEIPSKLLRYFPFSEAKFSFRQTRFAGVNSRLYQGYGSYLAPPVSEHRKCHVSSFFNDKATHLQTGMTNLFIYVKQVSFWLQTDNSTVKET